MKLTDFKIGLEFYGSAGFKWRCTDIGTRTISAIMLDPDKSQEWFKGPPYLMTEKVFDAYEMKRCHTRYEGLIEDRLDDYESSYHPGFDTESMRIMFDAKKLESRWKYRFENVFKRDRVSEDGKIWHPYSVEKNSSTNQWDILALEIFSKEILKLEDNSFILMKICTSEDLKARAMHFKKD